MVSLLSYSEIAANFGWGRSLTETKRSDWSTSRISFRSLTFSCFYQLLLKCSNTILFADDSVIYYSGKNCNEIQDLALVKEWLNDHRLTLNITKSKFVVVGGKQQLKHFKDMTLKIKEDELSRETSYKYLGIMINENMTWGDHIASLQQKVEKRIGLLKRISHLIPRAQCLTLVTTMITPLFDYGDTVWGIEITNIR